MDSTKEEMNAFIDSISRRMNPALASDLYTSLYSSPEDRATLMLEKHGITRAELHPATIQTLHQTWKMKVFSAEKCNTLWKILDDYGTIEHQNQCADQLMIDMVSGVPFNSLLKDHHPSSDRIEDSKGYSRDNVCFMFAKFNYAKSACPAFFNKECWSFYCETHGIPINTDQLKVSLEIVRNYFANVVSVYNENL